MEQGIRSPQSMLLASRLVIPEDTLLITEMVLLSKLECQFR